MFEAVRNNKRVAQIILAILIVPFAFFGMDAYFSDAPGGGEVASVGGSPIMAAEFEQALREQQDRLRNEGVQVDRAMLESEALRRAVLENLVNRRVLALYVAENRFSVTPQELQQTIAGVPAFQDEGQFSLQRYEALLRAQGMTPAMFEARLAQDVRLQQLSLAVGEGALVATESARRFMLAQLEEREVSEMRFAASALAGEVKLADDAVQKYYDSNAASLERPARVKAEYVVFDESALKQSVSVSDDEIRAYYESNGARFGQPEERQARHILIQLASDADAEAVAKARTEIESIHARLKAAPAQFEALAKELSQDPGSASRGGDLGFFGRGMMVKAFEDAAFAQQKGDIGEPVRSDFGFHIIQVTDVRAATTRPLESVRDEIRAELLRAAAGRRFAELAEQFSNTVYEQPDSLAPVAEALKLEVRQSDWVARDAAGLGSYQNAALVEALFSDDALTNRRNTQAIEVGNNTLVAARVVDYQAATRPPLDEVRAAIEAQLKSEEAARLAAERGAAALATLQKGEAVEGKWSAERKLQRGAPVLPANAMQAVFSASSAKLPAFVGVNDGVEGYVIYRISAVKRPEMAADDPQLLAVAEQYERVLAEREFAAFLSELRQRYKVEVKLPAKAAE
ncbi:SurA N-terminal domain-containing protein [Parazoarcus communis]|uniref:Periplasmic chaperone PpiD n=1 Tax=Parazoarcus communis SWub3 = DSM 12120 TaxID=1121029 RepID=A0A323UVM1_9RHOO|nr:SurA N-terminal domain-containing protein [Parazoarcus communis]NMG70212.1 peptidylprolyl isomerase [Parazoarcus communis SWub3 = DSM 12120]PZA15993.1 peptidylprolyl isomerase [Azoarcus communis] [Parazoarcus communis SWub3 = DSM 12120]